MNTYKYYAFNETFLISRFYYEGKPFMTLARKYLFGHYQKMQKKNILKNNLINGSVDN